MTAVEIGKPKLYYGYVVVAASAIILTVAWGIYYSYSIFFNSLLTEFGWNRAVTSGAFSISLLVAGVSGVIAGRISDRVGPKAVCIFCGICLGFGFILMSYVQSPWQVYLLYALPIAIGVGGLWAPAISTVARWFTGKRGLMTGIVAAGIGVGAVIFSPLISHFVSSYGWRIAFIIVGIISLIAMVSAGVFLRREPIQSDFAANIRETPQTSTSLEDSVFTFKQVARTKQFWIMMGIYFLFGYIQVTITVHTVPYASGLGISSLASAGILAVIGAANVFGRVIMGGIGDRFHHKPLFTGVLILLLVSCCWLAFSRQLWGLYLFGIIFGLSYGGSATLQSLVMVDLFGLASLGVLIGNLNLGVFVGGSFGPVISGYLFDLTGSYQLPFLICIFAAVVTLILIFCLTPIKRKKKSAE
jgi:MFS family permease